MEAVESRVLLSTSYTLNVLTTFNGDLGAQPLAGLIADASGNLYGTTAGKTGPADPRGSVFMIPAGSTTPVVLGRFDGPNGERPEGALLADPTGKILYGTTSGGGANGYGTVFKVDLNPTPATVTTLVSFDQTNGGSPKGSLAMDASGNLYGATKEGGIAGEGTLFKIAAGTSDITSLFSFEPAMTGSAPESGVILVNGVLYGSAYFSPTGNAGELFKYNLGTDSFSVLHDFAASADGAYPGGLIADGQGNLFGVTFFGSGTPGNIFRVDAGTSNLNVLASLPGGSEAANPQGRLTFGPDGNLYGVANAGGVAGLGGVFVMNHLTHVVSTLAAFEQNTTGNLPQGGLVFANGKIYGTTAENGANGGYGTVYQLFEIGPPAKLAFVQQPPNSSVAGFGLAGPPISVRVEDALGNLVTTDSSTVTLSVASPAGSSFGPGSTFSVAAVNGIATFNALVLNRVGTYTIAANDSINGGLTQATSNSFTITHAAASRVEFVVQPSSALASATILPAVVVHVKDQFGNLVTNNQSAVTLAIASGGGAGVTLGGTVTKAASGGVATFNNLSIAAAGTYTLVATDGVLGSATSSSFIITAPALPATHLVVSTQPSNAVAGATISPAVRVEVRDANGQVVVGNQSSVTLAIASGPSGAVLGGTLTVPVVNGVATFSNLSLLTAGTYTLRAVDGSLTGADSGSFVISAAAASQVTVTNPTVVAGAPTTVQAGVVDQYGNLVTGYNAPVTLGINGPTGTSTTPVTISAVDGLATFTISLGMPGNYSFTINTGSLVTNTVSTPVTVGYTQPTLVFSAPIGAVTAGSKIGWITLTLFNQSGVITDARPKVSLGILHGPFGGKLYGTTKVVGRNGQVTFKNIVIKKADEGTPYVLVSSAVGFGSGQTNAFVVVPAVAKKMVIVRQPTPSPVGRGGAFSVQVKLLDAYGNLATNDKSAVTISLGSRPRNSVLSGVLAKSTVGGMVDFTDLTVNLPGKYTFKFSDLKIRATSGRLVVT
jgi:uncharacterized repeat protein (TIGR03803 family)